MLGWLVYEISSPLSVTGGFRVYSLFHGVMSVSLDFAVEIFSLFVWSPVSSVCIYYCRCVAEVSGLGYCKKTVMSSAYDNM